MTCLNPIPGRRTRSIRKAPPAAAIGYLRVSTDEQAESGLGLEAQKTMVKQRAEQLGLEIVHFAVDTGVSGATPIDKRLGLSGAIAALNAKDAGALIAARLDRLTRRSDISTDLTRLAHSGGWRLITDCYDSGDENPMSAAQLTMLSMMAQYERDLISARTREALAALKQRGVKLGKPTTLPDEVLTRIVTEMSEGQSLRSIARGLMADEIPTGGGKHTWYAQTVKDAADSQRAQAIAERLFSPA